MYRSPLLLLYFLQNSLAILVWHLSQIPRLIVSVIFMGLLAGLFMTSAAAQNTQANTQANTDAASSFGLTVRQGAVIARPIAVSVAVQRSLFDHPAMQAGRARTCQALYRLGLNRAEARPQISGSISGQRQLFGHYKSSNNTDKDSAEARGVSERELNVYDVEVNLRHKIWDWHVTDNRIRSEQLAHETERLRLDLNLSEQLLQLLTLSIRPIFLAKSSALISRLLMILTPISRLSRRRGRRGLCGWQMCGVPGCYYWMRKSR